MHVEMINVHFDKNHSSEITMNGLKSQKNKQIDNTVSTFKLLISFLIV